MMKNGGDQHTLNKPKKSEMKFKDIQTLAEKAAAKGDFETATDLYLECVEQRKAELALINSVQEGLSSRIEMQAIYNLVGDILRDTFDSQVVMISQYDPQTDEVYHQYAIERGQHLQIQGWNPIDVSREKVVKTKKLVLLNSDEITALLGTSKMAVVPGTEVPKTWVGVPMLVGGAARGVVSLQNLDEDDAFTQSDLQLLTTLTNSLSISLENARLFDETQWLLKRLESEMAFARQAQMSILPQDVPDHPGYDIGSLIIPARAVGGDFYDFIPLNGDKMCIVIGDISDKGLSAALFMAVTLSFLRAETVRTNNPSLVLHNVNQFLLNMNAKMFVTLLYCVLDFSTGTLTYSRAGHLPPIIIDRDGKLIDIRYAAGLPLGLINDLKIDQQNCLIPKGGLALIHSDGLNEAFDSQGQVLGFQRIQQVLSIHKEFSARDICENLWQEVENHSGEIPHQDDFTTVIIKRH
jgi:serine phosphatase RsbU (regulator of sigma subunit)